MSVIAPIPVPDPAVRSNAGALRQRRGQSEERRFYTSGTHVWESAMLGPPKPRRLGEPIAVSLEELVPPRNFYRHLEAKLNLSFVREWTRELYADRGRPGIDPVVFFKLQLVMFFEGIRSERQLIETASLNLAHRWYLGYALGEEWLQSCCSASVRCTRSR